MIWRSILTTLFAAVLALTSVTQAVARHGALGGTTLVLCTQMGAQTVTLDAQGRPAPAFHPCPECVAALAAQDVPPALHLPLPPLSAQLWVGEGMVMPAPHRAPLQTHARGPPWMM